MKKTTLIFSLQVLSATVFAAGQQGYISWSSSLNSTHAAAAGRYGGAQTPLTLRLAPKSDAPSGSTVSVTEIEFASREDGTDASFISVWTDGENASGRVDSSGAVTNDTIAVNATTQKTAVKYSFENLSLVVGKTYSLKCHDSEGNTIDAGMTVVNPRNNDTLDTPVLPSIYMNASNDYLPVCTVEAEVVEKSDGTDLPEIAIASYRFDGSAANEGLVDLSFGTAPSVYVDGVTDKACNFVSSGDRVWANCAMHGPNDWTAVFNAKAPSAPGAVVASLGYCYSADVIAIATYGSGDEVEGVKVYYRAGEEDAAATAVVTAPLSGAASGFHSYALVYDSLERKLSLYIDSVAADSGLAGTASGIASPVDNRIQFGNVCGGVGQTGLSLAEDGAMNDFRLYDSILSEDALVKLHEEFLTDEMTASTFGEVAWSSIEWEMNGTSMGVWPEQYAEYLVGTLALTGDTALSFTKDMKAAHVSILTGGHDLTLSAADGVALHVGTRMSVSGGGTVTLGSEIGGLVVDGCILHIPAPVSYSQDTSAFPSAVTGDGTYKTTVDPSAIIAASGFFPSEWTGTTELSYSARITNFNPGSLGNSGSTVRLKGVTCYFPQGSASCDSVVELEDAGGQAALTVNDGYSGSVMAFKTLSGSGTLSLAAANPTHRVLVLDASAFAGNVQNTSANMSLRFADEDAVGKGTVMIGEGVSMSVPSGKTWTAKNGFVVESGGTLDVNGAIASSDGFLSGAGAVAISAIGSITNAAPTNTAWTGTVELKAASYSGFDFALLGNSASVIKFDGMSAGYPARDTDTEATVLLAGNVAFSDGYSPATNKVGVLTGTGDFSLVKALTSSYAVEFAVVSNYTGTLSGVDPERGRVIVDELLLGEIPAKGDCILKTGSAEEGLVALGDVRVEGEEWGRVLFELRTVDGQSGFYVKGLRGFGPPPTIISIR